MLTGKIHPLTDKPEVDAALIRLAGRGGGGGGGGLCKHSPRPPPPPPPPGILYISTPFYRYLMLLKASRKGKKSKQGFEVTPGNQTRNLLTKGRPPSAQLVSAQPSVREVPSSIPGDITSLFQLLSCLCSFN